METPHEKHPDPKVEPKAHAKPKRKTSHAKSTAGKFVSHAGAHAHAKRSASKKPVPAKREQKSAKKEPKESDKKEDAQKWTPGRMIAIAVVSVLLMIGAGFFFYQRYTYESTDDAMVKAHTTMLAPKVSGIVTQVLVDEHDRVKAGQVLVRLEQKDYLTAQASARANLEALNVQVKNAKRDLGRAAALYRDHAVTHQNLDHAQANYQDLDRQAKAAQAAVDQAALNIDYTELRAPTDGFISRKSVEVGMNATQGSALLGFVQTDERWVIANFKETQLDSVKVGKHVIVSVDAIPDKKFAGVVQSISPSSGATFTLFPPDNATGNFTKVVQRVPVKIYLKNLSDDDLKRLQAGLSAVVEVVKHSELESVPAAPATNYREQMAQSLPGAEAAVSPVPVPPGKTE